MKQTQPSVYLIAQSAINYDEMREYLESVGGQSWLDRIQNDKGSCDAEVLSEFAGRACYRSWEPGLNANVTKVRTDSGEYLANVLKSAHGSVFEHAQFTFVFHQVSRVFTHELVRHRVGVGISQESLRYVRLTDIGFRVAPVLEGSNTAARMLSLVEQIEELQRDAVEEFGLDNGGVPFHVKKEVTSALRRIAPIGLSTDIVWSANIRTIRHVLEMRTAVGAEEEIRTVFERVGHIMKVACPLIFGDYDINKAGEFKTVNRKV